MNLTLRKEEMDKSGLAPQFWMSEQRFIGALKNFTAAHYHEYIEILYCTDGKFDVWLNDDYYHFEKGDLVVINSEEVHSIDSVSDGVNSMTVLRFSPEIIYNSSQSLFEMKYILPFLINNNPPQKVFKCSELGVTGIPELIRNSYDEYKKKAYGHELAIRANICNIFVWILRYWNKSGFENSTTDLKNPELLPRFQEALQYMAEHFDEDLTAEAMAKKCNLSYSYFSRCFKKLINQSFSDYLNHLRVSEAVKLLMSTELNVTEIALQVGFSTSSYFIQQFKKFKGISPKQFKKQLSIREF